MEAIELIVVILAVTVFRSQGIYWNEHRLQYHSSCLPEEGYYKCPGSDICIDRGWAYNGTPECPSNTSEIEIECTDNEVRCRFYKVCRSRYFAHSCNPNLELPCHNDEFSCNQSERCIPRWMINDGSDDCSTEQREDRSDETVTFERCFSNEFECETSVGRRCIPREWVRDNITDCEDGMDETTALTNCNETTEVRCATSGRCVLRHRVLNGHRDCPGGDDEKTALVCHLSTEFRCPENGRCIPRSWMGDNLNNCPNGSDESPLERNEPCLGLDFRCHNDRRCLAKELLCDGVDNCGDCSDEIESCDDNRLMFRCHADPARTCIPWQYYCDLVNDCPNGEEDITMAPGFKCFRMQNFNNKAPYCTISQHWVRDNISYCADLSDDCQDSMTCFACQNEATVIASRQICDGVFDCRDLTDECLCTRDSFIVSNTAGELCDKLRYQSPDALWEGCGAGTFPCSADSDICVSHAQVCDGKVDCPASRIDEKFCGISPHEISENKTFDFACDAFPLQLFGQMPFRRSYTTLLSNFVATINATRCDGVVECAFFDDECSKRANCSNIPQICNDIPLQTVNAKDGVQELMRLHFVYVKVEWNSGYNWSLSLRRCDNQTVFGKQICNGVVECDRSELDEQNCTERFYCDGGKSHYLSGMRKIVSIPFRQLCDGNLPPDCVDNSDESNCSDTTHFYCENGKPLFVQRRFVLDGNTDCSDGSDECPKDLFDGNGISSREELIKLAPLRILHWVMIVLSLFGNGFAISKTVRYCKKNFGRARGSLKVRDLNKLLLGNLACGDFLMGIALAAIAAKQIQFSGHYCHHDKRWRSSTACNVIGALCVLSSEVSMLTLACMASYRLYSVCKPMKSRFFRVRSVVLNIASVWLISSVIALLPLAPVLSNYMNAKALIAHSPYFGTNEITLIQLRDFTSKLHTLSGGNSTQTVPSDWNELAKLVSAAKYPPMPLAYFGYYSASALCIPEIYSVPSEGQPYNLLSAIIISLNLASIFYITIVYLIIYYSTKNRGPQVCAHRRKQEQNMQRKFMRITITDICCWLPVCCMGFVSMAGVDLGLGAYAVSAIVLLPINSSLNPLIHSKAPEICFAYMRFLRSGQSLDRDAPSRRLRDRSGRTMTWESPRLNSGKVTSLNSTVL